MPLPILALGAAKFLRSLPLGVYLGIAAAAGFGFLQWKHSREVGALEKTVSTLESTLTQERLVHANTLVSLQAERGIVTTLTARIDKQNAEIKNWQAIAQASDAAASRKAGEALRAAEKAADAIRSGHVHIEPGHEGLNAELCRRFKACAS